MQLIYVRCDQDSCKKGPKWQCKSRPDGPALERHYVEGALDGPLDLAPTVALGEGLVLEARTACGEALLEHAVDPQAKLAVAAADGEVGRLGENQVVVASGPLVRVQRGAEARVVGWERR